MIKTGCLLLTFGLISQAQSLGPSVTALGTATVRVQPNQVTLSLSVVTQAGKARDAASRNSEKVAALQDGLKKVLSIGDEIRTVSYSMSQSGSSGYSSRSILEVKSTNPDMVGTIIDTAVGSGATSIGSVKFALKDPDLVHRQALAAATEQAKANAEAMARASGRAFGLVLAIREEGATVGSPVQDGYFNFTGGRSAKAFTPKVPTDVESGPIEVESSVVLQVQLN